MLFYLLYRCASWLAFPFLVLYVLGRVVRNRAYLVNLRERFGFLPSAWRQRTPGALWIHAVSVGEVISAVELIEKWRSTFPEERVFVSCSTIAGRELAAKRLAHVDGIFYLPFDYVFPVRRVLRLLRPSLVVVMETEIWPNLFGEVKRFQASLVIVNARISDRALARYRRIAWALKAVLPLPDAILAQSRENAARYEALGAPPERVRITGNLKFDFRPGDAPIAEPVRAFLDRTRPAGIWMAASTMPPLAAGDYDEDDIVIDCWKRIRRPDWLLILVPRKPERFNIAAEKLQAAGVPFVRRTQLNEESRANVLLVDTIGELGSLFALPSVVFMGGTLARRGGHNILEPAFFGRPIIIGPNMQNFAEIAAAFRKAQAVEQIEDPAELAGVVSSLMLDRGDIGVRAQAVAEGQRGATKRVLAILTEAYEAAVPIYRPAQPWFAVRWILSILWRLGAAVQRSTTNAVTLPVPVISVGGLTMGGAGKTPLVRWLSHYYADRRPAILTRGYKRLHPEMILLNAGDEAPVSQTGDEAQIYVRDRIAALGITKNRAAAARELLSRGAGIFLLDDGFQHWRLSRTCDIVVLDSRDPFGGGYVFPLGWLRESKGALKRADVVVLSRTQPRRTYAGVLDVLSKIAPSLEVWRAEIVPDVWISPATNQEAPASAFAGKTARIFAGLGSPESFARTVASLGIRIESARFFPDHHQYTDTELSALMDSCGLVLTTEKDVGKIRAERYRDLWYLRVGIRVHGFKDPIAR